MFKRVLFILICFFPTILPLSAFAGWGDIKEKIYFNSFTMKDYADIIDGVGDEPKVEVFGRLVIPKSDGKLPAIIIVHGSGGFDEKDKYWIKSFNKMGIATLQLDCFKPRGVSSTMGKQELVSQASMIIDSYIALKELSNHPLIDKDRIGIIGSSKGGMVALMTAWNPFIKIMDGLKFAVHIALYPFCYYYEEYDFSGAPILILMGEKDHIGPEHCIDFEKKLKTFKYPVKLVVYPKSYHAFDANYAVRTTNKGHSYGKCRLYIDNNGVEISPQCKSDSNDTAFVDSLDCCREKIPLKYGRNMKAKKMAMIEVQSLLYDVFKLKKNGKKVTNKVIKNTENER